MLLSLLPDELLEAISCQIGYFDTPLSDWPFPSPITTPAVSDLIQPGIINTSRDIEALSCVNTRMRNLYLSHVFRRITLVEGQDSKNKLLSQVRTVLKQRPYIARHVR
jgi:hypothetical protein